MRMTSKCRAWPCPACCTFDFRDSQSRLGPAISSHVSHIDEGEQKLMQKLHERCPVSGVPPCEPSRKAAGRPCTMAPMRIV